MYSKRSAYTTAFQKICRNTTVSVNNEVPSTLLSRGSNLRKLQCEALPFPPIVTAPSMSFLSRPPTFDMEPRLEAGRQVVGPKRHRVPATSVQPCPPVSNAPHYSRLPYPHGPPHPPHQASPHLGDPSMNLIPGNANEYRHHRPEGSPPIQDHRGFPPHGHASSYLLSAKDIKSEAEDDADLQPIRYTSSTKSFANGLPPAPHGPSHWSRDPSWRPLDSDAMPPDYPQRIAVHSQLPPPENYPQRAHTAIEQHPHYELSHRGYAQAAPIPGESHPITTHVVTKRKIARASQVRCRG